MNRPQQTTGLAQTTPPGTPAALRLRTWCPSPRGRLLLAMLEHKRLPYRPQLDANDDGWPRHAEPGPCAGLDIDGRLLTDLGEITTLLERLVPQRPLLPQAPEMRALCLALTDWAEHTLALLTWHHQWMDAAGERQRSRDFARSDAGQRLLARRRRAVRRLLLAQGWLSRTPEQAACELQRQLHTVDAMLSGRRFLFGQAPTLADFAIASQLAALAGAPASAAAMAQRPALGDYLARCWPPLPDEAVITQGSFVAHGRLQAAASDGPASAGTSRPSRVQGSLASAC